MGIAVALLARDNEKLDQTGAEFKGAGYDPILLSCDLTNREQVKSAVAQVIAKMEYIDLMVCASGMNIPQRSLRSLDPADWDKVIASNLTGTFNIIHAVLPSMRERGKGLIIQMGSLSGLRANTVAGAAYSAAKFAQMALATCIGREERGRNIRSTVICAGEVNTPFLNQRAGRPGGGEVGPGSRRDLILQPEDIAAAVRFLVELPERAHVPELIIKPTIDDFS